jgi:hypothetical protein
MKKRTHLFSIIGFFILLGFLSCKKNKDDFQRNSTEIEKQAKAWLKSIEASLPDSLFGKLKSKISSADFAFSKAISQENTGRLLFFIKVKDYDTKLDEYLSFAKMNNTYQTIGLIKVSQAYLANELDNIEKFVNHNTLDENFRLSFYRLNQRHISSYEGTPHSGLKQLYIRSGNQLKKGYAKKDTQEGRLLNCTDWYIVTTYTNPDGTQYQTESYIGTTCEGGDCQSSDPYGQTLDCINSGEGSGDAGGDLGNGNPYPDNGKLSCSSFSFTGMTSNMYEAGVKGLQFVMDVAGGGSITHNFRDIYVGFPSLTANGIHYSAGEAAAISAYAMNKAGITMSINYYGMSTTQASLITTTQLENEFKTLVQFYINQEINAGSTVSFNQSGSNTITKPAVWNSVLSHLWNGLTGSGCN